MLDHWNKSPQVDMLRNSDTLSWFRGNQSLYLLITSCLLRAEAKITNFIVFGCTWPGLEPAIYPERRVRPPAVYPGRRRRLPAVYPGRRRRPPAVYPERRHRPLHYTTDVVIMAKSNCHNVYTMNYRYKLAVWK